MATSFAETAESPLDTTGRPITPSRLRRAMNLNILVGAMGMAWFAICGPQHIFNVFFRNHLGASATALGLVVTAFHAASIFHLASIYIFGRLRRRKGFWAGVHVVHRLYAFVLAGVSLYAARGGDTALGVKIILGAMAVSWALVKVSASGWWSWMADLVPENIRGTFFGRRHAIISVAITVLFLATTILLDTLHMVNIFYVYAGIFFVAGLAGVLDILIHTTIPEPQQERNPEPFGWRQFMEPVRNRNFMAFALIFGLWVFSTGVFAPFIWPYVTAKDQIGAPQTWMGVCLVISQLAAIATATAWGIVMDRFGRKPAVLIGCLLPATWIGYFLLTPNNYAYILPLVALVGGVLQVGIITGTQQMMLTLTPQRNRTAFVSWFWATVGLTAAGGPYFGGRLYDALAEFSQPVAGIPVGGFHVVGLISLVLCGLSFLVLLRVREGREKPVGFVISRLATPGIFRTFLNISVLGGSATSQRTARALRTVEGGAGDLAIADVLARLDDPDHEVREEAARALGRIGATDAVEALIRRLTDPHSSIRPQAARALGRIGDPRAVPALLECLSGGSEDLQEACAHALGAIGGRESVRQLLRLLGEKRTERVLVSGAEAVSKHGIVEAAWEILPRMHATANPVLRRQLAIAMGNLLGRPGEFYQFLTGEQTQEGVRIGGLVKRARRALAAVRRRLPADALPDADWDELQDELGRVRGLMEGQSYRAAVEAFYGIVRRVVAAAIGREVPDETALEYALGRDVRLGLGFWFVIEVKRRMGETSDPELLHT
ncbi:MAG: MFS transporter, partial [Phycisphaerae bacterium]